MIFNYFIGLKSFLFSKKFPSQKQTNPYGKINLFMDVEKGLKVVFVPKALGGLKN